MDMFLTVARELGIFESIRRVERPRLERSRINQRGSFYYVYFGL